MNKAKELFIKFLGNTYQMYRAGVYDEYVSYAIDEQQEREWVEELFIEKFTLGDKSDPNTFLYGIWIITDFVLKEKYTEYIKIVRSAIMSTNDVVLIVFIANATMNLLKNVEKRQDFLLTKLQVDITLDSFLQAALKCCNSSSTDLKIESYPGYSKASANLRPREFIQMRCDMIVRCYNLVKNYLKVLSLTGMDSTVAKNGNMLMGMDNLHYVSRDNIVVRLLQSNQEKIEFEEIFSIILDKLFEEKGVALEELKIFLDCWELGIVKLKGVNLIDFRNLNLGMLNKLVGSTMLRFPMKNRLENISNVIAWKLVKFNNIDIEELKDELHILEFFRKSYCR